MGNISAGHELISRTLKKNVYGKYTLHTTSFILTKCISVDSSVYLFYYNLIIVLYLIWLCVSYVAYN